MTKISREENHYANVFAKLASFSLIESAVSARIEVVKSRSINKGLSILPIAFHYNWMDLIIAYLEEEKLPKDKLKARKLKLRVARYVIIGKTFYKKGFSMPYLQCVLPEEAEYILRGARGSMWRPCSMEIFILMNIKVGILLANPGKGLY